MMKTQKQSYTCILLLFFIATTALAEDDFVSTFEVHNCPVSGLALFEDEDIVITAGIIDNQVKVWRLSDYTLLKTISDHNNFQIRGVAALKNGDKRHFASYSFDKTIKIYDLKTLELVHTLTGSKERVMKVQYIKGSDFIASISTNEIRIWNYLEGGRASQVIENAHGEKQAISGLTWVSTSPNYVATFGGDNFIKVWDAETGENIISMKYQGKDKLFTMVFVEHLNQLITADMAGAIYKWNWKAGKSEFVYQDYNGFFPIDIVVVPNSNLMVTGGFSSKHIKFFDVSKYNTKDLYEKVGHTNEIWRIEYIPNTGYFLSTAADYSIKKWTLCQYDNEYFNLKSGKCDDNCTEKDEERKVCLSADNSKEKQAKKQKKTKTNEEL